MFVSKIGMDHIEMGMNCQDAGLFIEEESNDFGYALICDGCSQGLHSEVGAKTFVHFIEKSINDETICDYNSVLENMIQFFGNDPDTVKNYLCFTTLILKRQKDISLVGHCGDGYIIFQDTNDNITFEELSDGDYPKYPIYNFVNKKYLKLYQNGVEFTWKQYDIGYKKIGIASDGLRFIVNCRDEDLKLKDEFIDILKSGKESRMKRFINKNHRLFKDDITIAF